MSVVALSDDNRSVGGVSASQLRQFIERIETLEEEKAAIGEHIKDVMGEAKSQGFDTKTMRKVISLRKMKREDMVEQEELLDLYKSALGMG